MNTRYLAAAQFFSQLGRAEQALQETERHLSESPLDAGALVLRSSLLQQLGRLEEAEGEARQSLAIDPESAPAFRVLARIAREREQWVLSEEFARRSLAIQEHWTGFHALGVALLGQDRAKDALKCVNKSLELDPQESSMYLQGCVLLDLDLEQAENSFQRLMCINPEGSGRIGLAAVAGKRHRHTEAIGHLERALANDPENLALQALYTQAHLLSQVVTGPLNWHTSIIVILAIFFGLCLSALALDAWPAPGAPQWISIWFGGSIAAIGFRDAWQTGAFLRARWRSAKFAFVSGSLHAQYLTTAAGWTTVAALAWGLAHEKILWTALAQVVQVLIFHRLRLFYTFSAVILLMLPAFLGSLLCLAISPDFWVLMPWWAVHFHVLGNYLKRVPEEWLRGVR
ncbi:hypothetical protein IV102_33280 [bacterium]|nr:hypothetical protein [bacterium]